MRRLYIILCFIISLLLPLGCGQPMAPAQQQVAAQSAKNPSAANLVSAQVGRVVDGDTLVVKIAGKEQRVRLILVDTPESVHPDARKNTEYGKLASAFTASQLKEGQTIYLQKDVSETDKYGRLLRYVWLEQPADVDSETEVRAKMYNAKLLLEGYAQISTYPPDVKYADLFTKFQREARGSNKGLWGVQEAAPEQPASQGTGQYVGSKNSDKYHLPSCKYAQDIKPDNQVWFDSVENAKASGYGPCSVCGPSR